MIALREEGPFATISSRELSAPSFARILNLKEMDSTTVFFFCSESVLVQLYLILPAELKETMHEHSSRACSLPPPPLVRSHLSLAARGFDTWHEVPQACIET